MGGVAQCHAWLLLGADGGRMEGGWASSSSQPLPTLLSPQTSRGSARPSVVRLSLGWLPCTQGCWESRLVVGVRSPFADLSISLLPFCPVPRNGDRRDTKNLPLLVGGEEVNETKQHLLRSYRDLGSSSGSNNVALSELLKLL